MELGFDVNCLNPFLLERKGDDAILVPCGQCRNCRSVRTSIWSIRMLHELKSHEKAVFVTLTYSEECLPFKNGKSQLVLKHMQDYIKRVRKYCENKIKYFACGEYGEKYGRPHYHVVFFGLGKDDEELIRSKWMYGFIHIGEVTEKSCLYVAKYIYKAPLGNTKKYMRSIGREPQFQLQSKGIGKEWCLKNIEELVNKGIVRKGKSIGIPRYYNKLIKDNGKESDILNKLSADRFDNEVKRLKALENLSSEDLNDRYLESVGIRIEEIKSKNEMYGKRDKDMQ